jgi:hypothetical protein
MGPACTLTTSRAGSYSSAATSPTGDGWYDSGSTVVISAAFSGPFSFVSWSSSNGSLLVVSAPSSASASLQVGTYGEVTATFSVGQ